LLTEANITFFTTSISKFFTHHFIICEGENPDPIESSHEDTGSEIIEPYSFEPIASGEYSSSHSPVEYESKFSRLDNTDWCQCGQCEVMATGRECVCCCEIDIVKDKMKQSSNEVHCIIDHEGRYRYMTYCQLTSWCWGWLGKRVRVILPSCAVKKIRNTFPSDFSNYTGFKYPHL
ncbi:P2X purinoceptor 7-like, partial [Gigantopelta aegis]|uniref:P2X purinoceptor 7-like n=1 Tax=Gigantopelta aegis TaxID=1735272 RepID=UPI001B887E44